MRKKEPWMFEGSSVLALGKPGKITKFEMCEINEIMYVYYIHVQLGNKTWSAPYHPKDVQELQITQEA